MPSQPRGSGLTTWILLHTERWSKIKDQNFMDALNGALSTNQHPFSADVSIRGKLVSPKGTLIWPLLWVSKPHLLHDLWCRCWTIFRTYRLVTGHLFKDDVLGTHAECWILTCSTETFTYQTFIISKLNCTQPSHLNIHSCIYGWLKHPSNMTNWEHRQQI